MRYIFTLAILVLASSAGAAEICTDGVSCYTTDSIENLAAAFEKDLGNAQLCATVQLPKTCTQAQFDAAGGSGTIYPNTGTGTRDWLRDNVIAPGVQKLVAHQLKVLRSRRGVNDDAEAAPQLSAWCVMEGFDEDCED